MQIKGLDVAFLLIIEKGDFSRVSFAKFIWCMEHVSKEDKMPFPSNTGAYGFHTICDNKQSLSFISASVDLILYITGIRGKGRNKVLCPELVT